MTGSRVVLRGLLLGFTVVVLLLAGCSNGSGGNAATTAGAGASPKTSTATAGQLKVVASTNFWGNIVSQIGGDRVAVTSIITDPGIDPHLYSSNAQNAAAVAEADVVVKNGAGYDDFMDDLLGATKNNQRQVVSVQEVLGAGNDVNPHFWYDLPRMPEVAKAIEQALAAKYPSGSTEFSANLTKFEEGLQPALDTIATVRRKYAGAPVAYTERVTGYLLDAAGLVVKTPPGFASAVEEGNEPSPADSAAMGALIKGNQVKLLLYNLQATSPTTQRMQDLAKKAGVPVIGVTETLPPKYKTYQAWQLDQVQAVLQALGG